MKIALLADIHGNYEALAAVVADAQEHGVEEYWVAGDLISYGPSPNRVVSAVRQLPGARVVRGNVERRVSKKPEVESPSHSLKQLIHNWTIENLTTDTFDYLTELKPELRFEFAGKRVLLLHGSPGSDRQGIFPESSDLQFAGCLQEADADLLCCGHTHKPLDKIVAAPPGRILNPGTVGYLESGKPLAQYFLLEDNLGGELQVIPREVEYNWRGTVAKQKKQYMPYALQQATAQGIRLKTLLGAGMPEFDDAFLDERVLASKEFAARRHSDLAHQMQVENNASLLFDRLWGEHGLGYEEKVALLVSAHLHDVGWVMGSRSHHKSSRELILADKTLPFSEYFRRLVAIISRYHRGALPNAQKHRHFGELNLPQRWTLRVLAGILRIANAIDHSHLAHIDQVECHVGKSEIVIGISGSSKENVIANLEAARENTAILEGALGKKIAIVLLQQ